jgi:hypothetical protein
MWTCGRQNTRTALPDLPRPHVHIPFAFERQLLKGYPTFSCNTLIRDGLASHHRWESRGSASTS